MHGPIGSESGLGETFAATGQLPPGRAKGSPFVRSDPQRYRNRSMNNVKVFVLMAGLTSLFVAIGGYFGGQSGRIMALDLPRS